MFQAIFDVFSCTFQHVSWDCLLRSKNSHIAPYKANVVQTFTTPDSGARIHYGAGCRVPSVMELYQEVLLFIDKAWMNLS